jgi:hypothetical protein
MGADNPNQIGSPHNTMTFSSQMAPKKFLATKIVFEANLKGIPLSDGEQKLLLFREQVPESPTDIPDELPEGIDYEFEKKITRLLKAAYERDRLNPQELEQYQDAMQKLKGSDHYILVMAEPALAERHAARDMAIYIAIGLAVVGAAIAFALWQS